MSRRDYTYNKQDAIFLARKIQHYWKVRGRLYNVTVKQVKTNAEHDLPYYVIRSDIDPKAI